MTDKTVYRLLRYAVEGEPGHPFAVIVERGSVAEARMVGDLIDLHLDETESLTWIEGFLEARGIPADRAPLMENWRDWLCDYCESAPERRARMRRRLLTHTPGVSLDDQKSVRMKGSVAQVVNRLMRRHLYDPFELRVSDVIHMTLFGSAIEFEIRRRSEVEFSNGHRIFAEYALDRKQVNSTGQVPRPDDIRSVQRLGVPEPVNLPPLPAWVTRKRRIAQLVIVRSARMPEAVHAIERELLPIVSTVEPAILAVVFTEAPDINEYRRLRPKGIYLIPAMDQHAQPRLMKVVFGS